MLFYLFWKFFCELVKKTDNAICIIEMEKQKDKEAKGLFWDLKISGKTKWSNI